MKNFVRAVVFCFITGAIIFSINYYVDSYAAVRITYDKIANMSLESNYYVGTEIALSERKAKWAKINIMDRKQYIVMGSSRVEMLNAENMGKKSFYNMCVSGGSSVNDYLAEIYILYSQEKLPDKLLMEISPSIFNENSGETRWKEWEDNTWYMRQILCGEIPSEKQPSLGIQWKALFSLPYFQYNFQNLKENKRIWVENSDDWDNPLYMTVHMDGSYMYGRNYQNRYTEEQILQETENICNSRTIYCCGGYEEIDKDLKNTFEDLIQFLVSNDVEISFYLPPYSVPMYDFISNDDMYKVILEVEEYILDYAKKNEIEVLGSYDPSGSGLEIRELYDPYHVREEKIMDTLWRRS